MKTGKHSTYKVLRANGKWERFRVPIAFEVSVVASHYPNSLIVLSVPKGYTVHVAGQFDKFMSGPVDAVWDDDVDDYVVVYPAVEDIPQRELYETVARARRIACVEV